MALYTKDDVERGPLHNNKALFYDEGCIINAEYDRIKSCTTKTIECANRTKAQHPYDHLQLHTPVTSFKARPHTTPATPS